MVFRKLIDIYLPGMPAVSPPPGSPGYTAHCIPGEYRNDHTATLYNPDWPF